MSLDKELNEYSAKSGRSRVLHEEALAVMPGGNSRTTTFFDPYPFAIQRGQGAHVWDADGIDRLDFNGNYTSLILGHAPPDVVKAVQQAVELGLSFPAPAEPYPLVRGHSAGGPQARRGASVERRGRLRGDPGGRGVTARVPDHRSDDVQCRPLAAGRRVPGAAARDHRAS